MKNEKLLYIAIIALAALIFAYCIITTLMDEGFFSNVAGDIESFIEDTVDPFRDLESNLNSIDFSETGANISYNLFSEPF